MAAPHAESSPSRSSRCRGQLPSESELLLANCFQCFEQLIGARRLARLRHCAGDIAISNTKTVHLEVLRALRFQLRERLRFGARRALLFSQLLKFLIRNQYHVGRRNLHTCLTQYTRQGCMAAVHMIRRMSTLHLRQSDDLSNSREALIARLKLEIEKLRRELYGSRSERKAGCSSRWSFSSKISQQVLPKTSWPPSRPRAPRW